MNCLDESNPLTQPEPRCANPGHIFAAPDYPDQSTAYCLTCRSGGVVGSDAEAAALRAFREAQDAKPDARRWDYIPWDAP